MSDQHDPNERLFARKAKKYWLLVTGGMILLGLVNLAIGLWMWKYSSRTYDDEPPAEVMLIDAGVGDSPSPSVPDDGER